ncbi:MAG: hypothetical protein M1840_000360 [Geoglossum simile]|nr:MAG: hypothetical protein M1840_000360 [Geoglossum simile]
MAQHRGRYDFGKHLSEILDNQNHPLHGKYVDAIGSIRWPCTHGPVILTDRPGELFTDQKLRDMREKRLAWRIPVDDPPCSDFTDKYELYAYLGSGATGAAFAARTRDKAGDGGRLHVAAKFMPLSVPRRHTQGIINHREFGLIFNETLAMALLRDHPGIPALHAVYIHGYTIIIVMELFGVWPDKGDLDSLKPLNLVLSPDKKDIIRLKSCDGLELSRPHRYIDERRRPGEMEVCKMSSIYLSAFQLMKDRGCSHVDIAHRNLMIDENYAVRIIDWGGAQIHPSEQKWSDSSFYTKAETELLPPEWVRSGRLFFRRRKGRIIDDHRRVDLWRFSCVMYEYLHYIFPCYRQRPQSERELRLRHGELRIRDDLSQDCIDAYSAMLEQDPQSRGRTEELATLPWFSGFYLDTNHAFKNPLPSPFCPRPYSHDDENSPPPSFRCTSVICYGNPIASDENSLYRCFAEWKYQDQNRWQDIKAQTLQYYMKYLQGKVFSRNHSADEAKERVYNRIERETPGGVTNHLRTFGEPCPNLKIIRIIADALHCQAVILSWVGGGEEYRFKVYGDIHDKGVPEYSQIHLYYHPFSMLFELVMLYSEDVPYQFDGHTRDDAQLEDFVLDEDHLDILAEKQTAERSLYSPTVYSTSGYSNFADSSDSSSEGVDR